MIESVNNGKIKEVTKLQNKKYQDIEGKFLVEGEHLVEESFKRGLLEDIYVLAGNEMFYEGATIVSEKVMKKMTTLTNIPRVIGVSKKLNTREIKGNVLILDRIQDPGNMGTIIRSAAAFNIDTIIVGEGSVSIYNPKVVRASEGMLFHLNIIEGNAYDYLKKLKEKNYTIYSTDVNGGDELSSCNFVGLSAIVIGNEGAGVSQDLSNLSDKKLYINMTENVESLNVGVATSIILYVLNEKIRIK